MRSEKIGVKLVGGCVFLFAFFAQGVIGVVARDISELVGDGSSPGMKCTYPLHAIPVPSTEYPCSFDCAAPHVRCNDICQPPSSPCSLSPAPAPVPVQLQQQRPHSNHKRDSVEKRKLARLCHVGLTACKLDPWLARISSHKWDCVDTQSDLESCGGCAAPINKQTPTGIDCTAIPGVADVHCSSGACVVQKCLPGYYIAPNRTTCLFDKAFFRDGGKGRMKVGHDHGL